MNNLYKEKQEEKIKSIIKIVNQAKEILQELNENNDKLSIDQKYEMMQKMITLDLNISSETENINLDDDFIVLVTRNG